MHGEAPAPRVPSANRITLLRDADGDGVAETRSVFLADLNSPFGMALVGDELYVANADALVALPLQRRRRRRSRRAGTKVVDLPAGRSITTGPRTSSPAATAAKLYATVGSNSNVGENGMDEEEGRAAIWEIDAANGKQAAVRDGPAQPQRPGTGSPTTGALWTVVNERDELGSDLVPDYLTSVKDGAFYGWPYSYFGQNVDERVEPPRPDLVAKAVAPDYALGIARRAARDWRSPKGSRCRARFASGAFIGEHGSWNRKPPSGYKVVFVPFANGKPKGSRSRC